MECDYNKRKSEDLPVWLKGRLEMWTWVKIDQPAYALKDSKYAHPKTQIRLLSRIFGFKDADTWPKKWLYLLARIKQDDKQMNGRR